VGSTSRRRSARVPSRSTNLRDRNSGTDHYFVRPGWQPELRASFLIDSQGRGDVQSGDLNLSRPGTAAPIVRARVYGCPRDYIFPYLFLVAGAKYEHGGWKVIRGFSCLSPAWYGGRYSRSRMGC